MSDERYELLCGDALDLLRQADDRQVRCVISSPPYWGLRDYKTGRWEGGDPNCKHRYANPQRGTNNDGSFSEERTFEGGARPMLRNCRWCGAVRIDQQIGLEPSIDLYVQRLVEVFREIRRVLTDDGTVWLNLGDSYVTRPRGNKKGDKSTSSLTNPERQEAVYPHGVDWRVEHGRPEGDPKALRNQASRSELYRFRSGPASDFDPKAKHGLVREEGRPNRRNEMPQGLKHKDLIGVPWEVAFALRRDGWWLRDEIIWHKTNPLPESVRDRPTRAHESLFLLSKSDRYHYDCDAIKEPASSYNHARTVVTNTPEPPPGASPHRGLRTTGLAQVIPIRKNDSELAQARSDGGKRVRGFQQRWDEAEASGAPKQKMRNKRDVWRLSSEPYKGAHMACVDDQTEALTQRGWLQHTDLRDGDLIAAFDGSKLRWEPATFHRYEHEGELIAVEKLGTSQRMTPNHRCLVKKRAKSGGYETKVVLAEQLNSRCQLPVSAEFDCPGRGNLSPEWAALVGWYVADGSTSRPSIYQSISANSAKCEEIERLLKAVGAKYGVSERTRTQFGVVSTLREYIVSGEAGKRLVQLAPRCRLTPELAMLPKPAAQALFDALIDGDGHRRVQGVGGKLSWTQKNENNVDLMHLLAARLGWRVVVSSFGALTPRGFPTFIHNLSFSKKRWITMRGGDGATVPLMSEHYSGVVWCPSVPSTFWLARRKGRQFITGNTMPTALVVLAGSAPNDLVLDPFCGSGTVGVVALKHGRRFIGMDLQPDYLPLARERIEKSLRPPEPRKRRKEKSA